MDQSEDENKIIKFDDLNLLGKLVYVSGVLTRTATGIVQTAVDATSEIITEAEKAFKQGLDPNVDDATILEEINDTDTAKSSKNKKG